MKNFIGKNALKDAMGLMKNDLNKKEDKLVEYTNSEVQNMWGNESSKLLKYSAPEIMLTNWKYTLNESNHTIDLTEYDGTDQNIIIYDEYIIGDKIYKTKLKGGEALIGLIYQSSNNVTNTTLENVIFGDYIDTSEMTSCMSMFEQCNRLSSIKFGKGFNTSNVTNMSDMFYDCRSLTTIDVSSFNTSNVTDMSDMFLMPRNSSSLLEEIIGLNKFNTSKVTSMNSMFSWIKNLKSLDLSSFDTHNVTDMNNMFSYCSSLTSLDLTSFDIHNVTKIANIFKGCTNLKEILVSRNKWVISDDAIITDMFSGCGVDHVTYVD